MRRRAFAYGRFPVVPTKARRAAWRDLASTKTAFVVGRRFLHAALRALVGTTGKPWPDVICDGPPDEVEQRQAPFRNEQLLQERIEASCQTPNMISTRCHSTPASRRRSS